VFSVFVEDREWEVLGMVILAGGASFLRITDTGDFFTGLLSSSQDISCVPEREGSR
jgi:hypothetical protein